MSSETGETRQTRKNPGDLAPAFTRLRPASQSADTNSSSSAPQATGTPSDAIVAPFQ